MEVLRIEHLLKRYSSAEGVREVVRVGRYGVEAGERVGILGESGSGKTTLLNLIAGILKADSGVVEVCGRRMTAMSEGQRDRFRATHIGYLFQTFNLLQGYSALENVMMAMHLAGVGDRPEAVRLLERVGLSDRLHDVPGRLSIGQQQRVAIARALATRPALLLADEPTSHLDPDRAGDVMDLIVRMCDEANAALVVVTHETKILDAMTRVDRMEDLSRGAAEGAA